jgi:hypothetical protein
MRQVFEFMALVFAFVFFVWQAATVMWQLLRDYLNWVKGNEDDDEHR